MSAKGMTATVIATFLAKAVADDEAGEGCDLSAGVFGPAVSALIREIAEQMTAPIDMVLHCPACLKQHIDEPDPPGHTHVAMDGTESRWDNPPHRSHLCKHCGFVWRPADAATNGVAAIKTKGKDDSPIVQPRRVAELVDAVQEQIDHAHMNGTRTVPQFGKIEGSVAVRTEYLDAVLSRFKTP